MRKTLLAVLVSLVACPLALGAREASLPPVGVLTPGVSLGGVHVGDTAAAVRRTWGSRYRVCKECDAVVWYYLYPRGEPLGAAVKFGRTGRVVAVFTLGSPTGWRTREGLLVGEGIGRIPTLYGALAWHRCIGYAAMSMRKGDIVTSIYTTGEVVYGFALTAPTEPVCQ